MRMNIRFTWLRFGVGASPTLAEVVCAEITGWQPMISLSLCLFTNASKMVAITLRDMLLTAHQIALL